MFREVAELRLNSEKTRKTTEDAISECLYCGDARKPILRFFFISIRFSATSALVLACKQSARDSTFWAISSHESCRGFADSEWLACLLTMCCLYPAQYLLARLVSLFPSSPAKQLSPTIGDPWLYWVRLPGDEKLLDLEWVWDLTELVRSQNIVLDLSFLFYH